MKRRPLILILCVSMLALAVWVGGGLRGEKPATGWTEVAPGIWRTAAMPHGHALVADGHALLIDCPQDPAGLLKDAKVKQIDAVLLTHHHRDTCALAAKFVKDKVPVRAPKASAEWLSPAGVAKFWAESIPLRNSRTSYFVVPEGIDGIDFSLDDGQTIDWRGWRGKVIATPGHSRDHVAFSATRDQGHPPLIFFGDALA